MHAWVNAQDKNPKIRDNVHNLTTIVDPLGPMWSNANRFQNKK
jgi:hypothetical protein